MGDSDDITRGAPLHPGPTTSESISNFLGYMQRRLSDFVAADSRAIQNTQTCEGNDAESQRARDYAAGDDSALGEDESFHRNNQEASIHHLNESPSLHRAG